VLATLDPAAGYRRALLDHLERATLVVDHFHAIKLDNTAIDDIRRRVQQDSTGHRGRKGDPLYRIRRALLAEKIRRNAHGFTNHDNYRRRLLGRLGVQWHTVPTQRIRGRQPRLIA